MGVNQMCAGHALLLDSNARKLTETAPAFGGFLEGALEAAEHAASTLALHDPMQT